MKSKFLELNTRDVARGLVVALGTGIVNAIPNLYPILMSGIFPNKTQWISFAAFSLKSSLSAMITYLTVNVFTNSTGNIGPDK